MENKKLGNYKLEYAVPAYKDYMNDTMQLVKEYIEYTEVLGNTITFKEWLDEKNKTHKE